MKRVVIIPILILSGVCVLSGCKAKEHDKIDISSIHTSAATTQADKETLAPTIPETTVAETQNSSDTVKDGSSASNVSAKLETYRADGPTKLSIEYPVVSNMADTSKQTAVNQLLKTNAVSIEEQFKPFDANVTIDIKCKVVSVDRKRLTAVYTGIYTVTGGAYPTNLFYTNTIDLENGKNLGFNNYSDAYTMAGYVMSDDCEFYDVSSELKQELLAYRATQSLETYTDLFNAADFPLKNDSTTFPESFSYVNQGVLYFSIPVPHALGDYAIVKFNLDGK